jgi:aerobic-type carbon monoxide dehydrogenase small subunit (CoxS/CutS family)/carbon monoxide dehydrogenase subunit G
MTPITLDVNGRSLSGEVEPRTHLADFLRGALGLTGTHLGCEQGVCGACTVLIDGMPQRACIAYAVDCDGGSVTTIEGFDADPVMQALREAFSVHHALQCGFCTPGMLVSARDLVLRLGEVPEARIREEMSGNLCRCTGYVGIVDAIGAVCAGRAPQPAVAAAPVAAKALPVPTPEVLPEPAPARTAAAGPTARGDAPSLQETIRLAAAPEAVWRALSDLRRVAACLPGAQIDTIEGDRLSGRMRVSLGPLKVAFAGTGTFALDDAAREGHVAGRGRDSGSNSSAEGDLRWRVAPDDETGGSLVLVTLSWRLTGLLAQFNRANLVADLVGRLAATFAANLEADLAGRERPVERAPLNGLALLWTLLKAKLLGR